MKLADKLGPSSPYGVFVSLIHAKLVCELNTINSTGFLQDLRSTFIDGIHTYKLDRILIRKERKSKRIAI